MKVRAALVVATLAAVLATGAAGMGLQDRPPVYGYRLVHAYPHDPAAYTQGLIYRDGFLYESTGLNGRSSLRQVRLETGEVLRELRVDAAYFAEGLTDWHDQLIQLTWQSGLALVYDFSSFRSQTTFRYPGEGWGLTHDAQRLILSDGTSTLRLLDPVTFVERGRVQVRDGERAIDQLNELEYVQGEIFANIWHANRIARISPRSGRVLGWIDLSGLLPSTYRLDPEAVLNGIAYDAARKRLFVTGKLWPRLYEIVLVRRS